VLGICVVDKKTEFVKSNEKQQIHSSISIFGGGNACTTSSVSCEQADNPGAGDLVLLTNQLEQAILPPPMSSSAAVVEDITLQGEFIFAACQSVLVRH